MPHFTMKTDKLSYIRDYGVTGYYQHDYEIIPNRGCYMIVETTKSLTPYGEAMAVNTWEKTTMKEARQQITDTMASCNAKRKHD